MLKALPSFLSNCSQLVRLKHISIKMYGDEVCRALYNEHNSWHPRYKIIKFKRWGVALLKIPDSIESFLTGRDKHDIRTKLNRCIRLGYKFEFVDSNERIKEIFEINKSMPVRQGRNMDEAYLDFDAAKKYFQIWPNIYSIIDNKNILRAYATVKECGEVAVINQILGHGDNLKDGIMYFLMIEILKKQITNKSVRNNPVWLMYDIFFTPTPGLQFFKDRIGFKPFVVNWKWMKDGD